MGLHNCLSKGIMAVLACMFLGMANMIEAKPFGGTRSLLEVSSPRWYTPCAGSNPTGEVIETPVTRPLRDAYYHIALKSTEIKHKIEELKERYIQQRFGDPQFVQMLSTFKIGGVPDVEVTDEALTFALQQTDEFLIEVYNHLAAIAVFVDKMKLDELSYEDNGGYKDDIAEIESMNYEELCNMFSVTVTTKGLTLPETVTTDIIPADFRDLASQTNRWIRDYIILRDYKKLMNYVHATFQHLMDNTPESP